MASETDYTKLYTLPIAEEGWVMAHNALRFETRNIARLLAALEVQLKRGEPVTASQSAAIVKQWELFYEFLEDHHTNETGHMFPWASTRATLPERLTTDHDGITRTVDECAVELKAILDTKSAEQALPKVQALKAKWLEWQAVTFEHYLEEEAMIPTIRKHFTPKEQKKEEDKIIRKLRPVDLNFFLQPLSMDEKRKWMKSVGMPFFIVWLFMWRARKFDAEYTQPFATAIRTAENGAAVAA